MDALEKLSTIPIALPTILLELAGCASNSRYISLSYVATNATWSDGRSAGTFNYFFVYEPFISHLAIALHIGDRHLGCDDYPPTHALLCDQRAKKIYVGSVQIVDKILRSQHPPNPPPQQLSERDIQTFNSLAQFHEIGMFEFLGRGSNPKLEQGRINLIHALDQSITEPLIEQYLQLAREGDRHAEQALYRFKLRIEATLQKNSDPQQQDH